MKVPHARSVWISTNEYVLWVCQLFTRLIPMIASNKPSFSKTIVSLLLGGAALLGQVASAKQLGDEWQRDFVNPPQEMSPG